LQLLEIAPAIDASCFLLGAAECGQKQGREDGDNGDDDQQFDQGKRSRPMTVRKESSHVD
jgi:hypothetical protein